MPHISNLLIYIRHAKKCHLLPFAKVAQYYECSKKNNINFITLFQSLHVDMSMLAHAKNIDPSQNHSSLAILYFGFLDDKRTYRRPYVKIALVMFFA